MRMETIIEMVVAVLFITGACIVVFVSQRYMKGGKDCNTNVSDSNGTTKPKRKMLWEEDDLSNTQITKIHLCDWTEAGKKMFTLSVAGDYSKDDYRHYSLTFGRIDSSLSENDGAYLEARFKDMQAMNKPLLKSVSSIENPKGNAVEIELEDDERSIKVSFQCGHMFDSRWRYLGMNYDNVYGTPEYLKWMDARSYVFDDKYFSDESVEELPDGYSLYERNYIHKTEHAYHAYGSKSELRKNDQYIYAYTSNDNHHSAYKEFICHSNGHRYYPFHIDLYGISFIDVDTLEVFNYVPRGYDNDHGLPAGESFIILDVHYDTRTNLVAYDGCYWAGPSDVMVGKLDDPLHFDPHLISLGDYFDSEHEELPEITFLSWDEDGLTVKYETEEQDQEQEQIKKVSLDILYNEMKVQDKQQD